MRMISLGLLHAGQRNFEVLAAHTVGFVALGHDLIAERRPLRAEIIRRGPERLRAEHIALADLPCQPAHVGLQSLLKRR